MAAAYPHDTSATAWLSRGFEVLEGRVLANPAALHFDVLIVGSGYGGAVAAATFAGRTHAGAAVRVGALERGREYLRGAFPTGLRELPRHIRRKRYKEGLFDIRLGPEVNTVLANGVGGGSLINAGVMEIPQAEVFTNGWPSALASLPTWRSSFDAARDLLGARQGGLSNTILKHPDGVPQKYKALQAIAPASSPVRAAEITVAMADATSSGNVELKKCVRCGDCATGCNFGAKISLDVNLLARAHAQGAEIFSGATVLNIERDPIDASVWLVHCVHTSAKLRSRDETQTGKVVTVRASKVVLAAGALGSTEILLRSKAGLTVSDQLGRRCSTNGDMLITDYDTQGDVHTIADERVTPSQRAVGPTITGIIDLPKTQKRPRLTIEEMSVPAGLRLAFTEIFATINALHSLADKDSSKHERGFPNDDIYAVSEPRINHTALYAVMGDDGAAGSVELVDDGRPLTLHEDGVARMRWPEAASQAALPDIELFDRQVEALATLTNNTQGRLLPNPAWKLLPADLEWLLKSKRGPLTTVHPLGGCAMADSSAKGVVDDCGRVFAAANSAVVYDGLVVLDGSIVPTALGTNPALTITAVALRATELLAVDWGYAPAVATPPPSAPLKRPVFRHTDTAFLPRPTKVEVIERLVGRVEFEADNGALATRVVELTLRFAPHDPTTIARVPQDGVLQVATDAGGIASRIRIYDAVLWDQMEARWTPERRFEDELEALALFSAPLRGSVIVLERQKSRPIGRIWRAARAWWGNRGKRDTHESLVGDDDGPGVLSRIVSGIALASRAGEIRAFTYDLTVGNPDVPPVFGLKGANHTIKGYKTFTYARRANPWRQLMEVELDEFPGLKHSTDARVLKLDPRFLARIGVPLLRIASQNDGLTALADLGAFFGYFLRLLLGLHIWSFRAPDPDTSTTAPERLPRKNLPGLPPAEQFAIPLPPEEPAGGGAPYSGQVIVTHFPPKVPDPQKRPLVMLHGYSASGTTFAHHAVPKNFAEYLSGKGWDIWIGDLRTSSGQADSAVRHWSFEQIGRVDVPALIDKVIEKTGAAKVDVIAHCMGTVAFSMAVLNQKPPLNNVLGQVERAVFTQVGPLVAFSPANVFRGYALRYFIDFLPEKYSFRPENPTLADDLWDRLLATLPYPEEEFDVENPPGFSARTPWTRTRHRMDALYGRDFNVVNMEPDMLRCIDDHFGPLSLRTVAQTLHFVRYSMMTTYQGHNDFVSRALLKTNWTFPTTSVHGAANGLSHVSTVDRMSTIFADAGCNYLAPTILPDTGHQDALVGTKRSDTLATIEQFLAGPPPGPPGTANDTLVAYTPWLGPIITEQRDKTPALIVRLGSAPMHRKAEGVVMIRIAFDGDRIVRPDNKNSPWDAGYVLAHMALYLSSELEANRWDAFEAPLPTQMPGNESGDHTGDGLLVLILYAESKDLFPPPASRAAYYLKADTSTKQVLEFSPTPIMSAPITPPPGDARELVERPPSVPRRDNDPAALTPRESPIDYEQFGVASTALFTALAKQRSALDRELPTRERLGHAQLLAARVTVPIELPLPAIQLPPTNIQAALQFGTNTATALPVVEAIDQDHDIMDGVIPYDPPPLPQPPPPQPPPPPAAGIRFGLVSCQYPAGFLDGPVAHASYRRLLERLDGPTSLRPRFAVLAGDQVYVDPTAGLYDPSALDDRYDRPYELWLRQHAVRTALRRIPTFMLLDDHEIDDDWEPLPAQTPDSASNVKKYKGGLASYDKYQRGMMPKSRPFKFTFDDFPFFMLDTRAGRKGRNIAALGTATLFDDTVLQALEQWLTTTPAGPKFIVTPSLFLPRHRRAVQHAPLGGGLDTANLSALHSDGWDGYPRTLRAVLGVIAKHAVEHVVFLSGDEHRGCVTEIHLRKQTGALITRAHSIHTTAAYAPFPFANSLAEDFVAVETIDFTYNGTSYKCDVNATLPATADGATLLRAWSNAPNVWLLEYEYADGGAHTLTL